MFTTVQDQIRSYETAIQYAEDRIDEVNQAFAKGQITEEKMEWRINLHQKFAEEYLAIVNGIRINSEL